MVCSTLGDEIVITGIAGSFPNSDNVDIFQRKLLNMENCLSNKNPKWKTGNVKLPDKNGFMPGVDKFDAKAFGIHKKFTVNLDPLTRMIIRCAYESIADAGINPRLLKGKKIAVFTGIGTSEIENAIDYNTNETTLLGSARAMQANRVSFFLGLEGTSTTVTSMCTSGATALEKGYFAIKNGEFESAIVAGGNIALHPYLSLSLSKLGLLSPDGLTKSFDESANGFTRSEAVVVFFLQKARDAKRIYAEVKNVHSWNGPCYDRFSALYPTSDFQTEVMKLTLKECGLTGKDVSFVEADGIGVKEADVEEIKAIDQVYNDGRIEPLLIGSVKSNVGSCHAANTLVSIVKVITMMETGNIPPNLHYKSSSKEMSAIQEGRIKVITEPTSWNGEYVAVNTASMSGGFASVILKSYNKKRVDQKEITNNLPKLLMVSGVTEDAVNVILDYMESKPVNSEMFQLLNDVFEVEHTSHLYRGYTLLPPFGNVASTYRKTEFVTGFKREIWYVFSGMGSQWVGMGKDLLNIPLFAESVRKCDAVLQQHGIDILHILTSDDSTVFDNIIHSFVGIATIQIGLVDLLNYFGIKCDYMIGHSVGELGCAYADGCLTAEQTVLNAYFRGLASVESKLPKGLMASVGLGYEDIKQLCPPDIDVACHNSQNNSTLSGPANSMKKFISDLQMKGIFAKEVATSNIAYHSRYIAPAGAKLLEYLKKIVPDPKVRSAKWLSTSVPCAEWNTAKALLSSAEYYTNNLLNPVCFEEITKKIPKNSILIEIAPHGLLQAILKKSLSNNIINLSLTRRGHPNNIEILMDALGKLYINSGNKAQITKLYPRIAYPVSTGTPSLSSLIRWDHSEVWSSYIRQLYCLPSVMGEKIYKIDLKNENWEFLKGNKIDNKIVLPLSLYLKLVIVTMKTFDKSEKPITFKNVVVHKNQCLNEDKPLDVTVMVQRGLGCFEVTTDKVLLCSGILRKIDLFELEEIVKTNEIHNLNEELGSKDIYNELLLRGCQYSGSFKTLCKVNLTGCHGEVFYQNDWDLFLDGMLQLYMFTLKMKTTHVPFKIRELTIDFASYRNHSKMLKSVPVSVNQEFNVIQSTDIEIHGVQLITVKQLSNQQSLRMDEIKLTLNSDARIISPTDFAKIILQVMNENNVTGKHIQLLTEDVHITDDSQKTWQTIFKEFQEMQFEIDSILLSDLDNEKNTALKVFFDITTLTNANLSNTLKEGDFILAILDSADETEVSSNIKIFDLGIILSRKLSKNQVALLLRMKRLLRNTCVFEISDKNFTLTDEIKEMIDSPRIERIIFSARLKNSSVTEEIFSLFSKPTIRNKVRYFEILDKSAPKLTLEEPFYRQHLQLDLKFNIFSQDSKWGFRRCSPITTKLNTTTNYMAFQTRPNDMNSLDWVERCDKNVQVNNLVKVEYSTINASDIHLANDEMFFKPSSNSFRNKKIKQDMTIFGSEYAGTNTRGDRIMGISASGTLCSFTFPDAEFTWEVPNSWTLEEAATVPLAYLSAYMALFVKVRIGNKKTVFVYDGSTAIGEAVINVALNEKLKVFATFKTIEQKERLKLKYPALNDDQLFSAEDSFVNMLLYKTKGVGIDILIYNSSNVNKIESFLTCIKIGGQVIIIGELQKAFERSVGMGNFLKKVNIHSIMPHNLVNADANIKNRLSSMVTDGLRMGVIKPLFSNLYSRNELRKAFRDVRNNVCHEKLVIKIQPLDSNCGLLATTQFTCFKSRSYLLVIDNWNNLFGIKMVDFLIEHGATDILVISSSSTVSKALYNYYLKIWEESEAKVVLQDNWDLSNSHNVKTLLIESLKVNPIDAIFDLQRMTKCSQNLSKYFVTKNLFEESKQVCTDLRHFVICAILEDSIDDFNTYMFKNNNLVTLCEKKLNDGLPTQLALWDPIQEIVETESLKEGKYDLLSIHKCILELSRLMTLPSGNFFISKNLTVSNDTKLTSIAKETSERELFENYIFNRM